MRILRSSYWQELARARSSMGPCGKSIVFACVVNARPISAYHSSNKIDERGNSGSAVVIS